MTSEDNIHYHTDRARRELDMGLLSQSIAASRAHLQLASLHMQRLRELTGQPGISPLAM
jgi:hypothetical protein